MSITNILNQRNDIYLANILDSNDMNLINKLINDINDPDVDYYVYSDIIYHLMTQNNQNLLLHILKSPIGLRYKLSASALEYAVSLQNIELVNICLKYSNLENAYEAIWIKANKNAIILKLLFENIPYSNKIRNISSNQMIDAIRTHSFDIINLYIQNTDNLYGINNERLIYEINNDISLIQKMALNEKLFRLLLNYNNIDLVNSYKKVFSKLNLHDDILFEISSFL